MYGDQGQLNSLFAMLYGGVAVMALLSCIYFIFSRSNIIQPSIKPPRRLRLWAAAFLAAMFASHVWWLVIGSVWLTDDRFVRIITLIALDNLTLPPLFMAMMLRLLQDRRRPLWPVFVAAAPTAVFAVIGITTRQPVYEWVMEGYTLTTGIIFCIYMIVAVKHYGRWLRDNFADLEHKEVWQSLLAPLLMVLTFCAYAYHEGQLYREYLTQIASCFIIFFIIWRVETLQTLEVTEAGETDNDTTKPETETNTTNNINAYQEISDLLREHCEQKQLYLQHNLTLQQLATAIGTNRTYLSAYFNERNETYNSYINRLRVEHFAKLYHKANANGHSATAKKLAIASGFHSYSTFSVAFKSFMGMPVRLWIRKINEEKYK